MKKQAIILGSTGSIGRNTLDVIDALNDEWGVVALAAGSRWRELATQCNKYRPQAVAIADEHCIDALNATLTYKPTVFSGKDGLTKLIDTVACDCVIAGMGGVDGLPAILRAVEMGLRIGLANKEALVVAGSLLVPLAEQTGAAIIPVDSEHSAIFQALLAGHPADVRKVYLTASGGPFRTWSADEMSRVRVDDALRHPTWNMGPKITIDSATMMNKALEIVEARWLFHLEPERIGVVIHPESIIHSLVEFQDGSMIAQLGTPDMRTPIQYALTHPRRQPCPSKPLDLLSVGQLTLDRPDPERFPALQLGFDVARRGGTSGAVLNAANEAAVQLFREGAIRFADIARYTGLALDQHEFVNEPTLEQLSAAARWAREEVTKCMAC